MTPVLSFLLGVAATLAVIPVWKWAGKKLRRYQAADRLERNRVTTVTQVLHLAVQGAPTGISVLDRDGDVVLSNARAHELNMVHERTLHEKIAAAARDVFSDTETRNVRLDATAARPGTRVVSVAVVVQPLTFADNRYVVAFGTDESEAVRMEEARRDFVANVSHELKTPVGGMALLSEALLEAVDDPDQVRFFGVRLHKEARRMSEMIKELISLSKLQGAHRLPEMEPLSVDEIIDEALERTQLAAENAHSPLRRGPSAGVYVLGEKDLLVTALTNLISNAINYSPEELPVSVTQRLENEDTVLIRVTDRGIGIRPEDQERVFERFYRVDKARSRSTGGTGLGLSIVKHVVLNHGGTIRLWSQPGTGSTFSIVLPVYHPEEPAQQPPEQPVQSSIRKAVSMVNGRRKEKNQL